MKKRQFQSGLVLYGILMLIIAGFMVSCNGGGSGSDETEIPAVVGSNAADYDYDDITPGIQFWYLSGSFSFQLYLDNSIVPLETIEFRSSSSLPAADSYIELNEVTGEVTVNFDGSTNIETVYFWSVGISSGDDTSSTPLRLDLEIVSG